MSVAQDLERKPRFPRWASDPDALPSWAQIQFWATCFLCLLWCPRRPGARCNVYMLELDLESGAGTCQGRGERALVPAHTHAPSEITIGTVFVWKMSF